MCASHRFRAGTVAVLLCCPSAAATADGERAVVPLTVNEVPRGEAVVLLRPGDVLVRLRDLEGAGVRGLAGRREERGGEVYVSLSSLAPEVRFELDERALTLRLTVPPRHLGSTRLTMTSERPAGIVYSKDTSAFLNYAVHWGDFERYQAFAEAGLSLRGSLLLATFSRRAEGSLRRESTSLTIDERGRLRRWRMGDVLATAGPLGGGVFLGGLAVSRDFGLDPYFVRTPTLGLAGAIETPSTVEVYVNGALVRRQELPPGQFELEDLAVPVGSGSTRLVIRDLFGRERVVASPYYLAAGLLRRGLSDYGYHLGFRRNADGSGGAAYGSPVFLARHRLGLTDQVTAGVRLEAGAGLLSGGPGLTARVPFGELDVNAAASRSRGRSGWAASAAFTHSGPRGSLGTSVRAASEHYAHTSLEAQRDRPRLESAAALGLRLGARVGLGLQYSSSVFRERPSMGRVSLSTSARLSRRANLFVSAGRAWQGGAPAQWEAFAGLSHQLGSDAGANVSLRQLGERGTAAVEVHRSLPVGTGFGGRLLGESEVGQAKGSALLQYQGPFGRYELTQESASGRHTTSLSATGALVWVGGRLLLARAVQDGFALLRLGGVRGVRASVSNQVIGRSDARGDVLVPNLLPYYGNRLSIADEDVPLHYSVEATEKTVAPPYRGGAVVSFPVRRIQSVAGTIVLVKAGKELAPTAGLLRVTAAGKTFESPLGKKGEFYLENVPAGRHPARIEAREAVCEFTLEVKAVEQPFLNLGALRCVAP